MQLCPPFEFWVFIAISVVGTKYKVVFSCTTVLNSIKRVRWFTVINVAKFELIVLGNRKSWMFVFCKLFLRHFEHAFVSNCTSTKLEVPECWF